MIHAIADLVDYRPGFIGFKEAQRLYELSMALHWQQNQIEMYGKKISLPRLETMYSVDPTLKYTVAGYTIGVHPFDELPWLAELRQLIAEATGYDFPIVIGNRYDDGKKAIGYHADDKPEIGRPEDVAIASLSLGATRRFLVKPNEGKAQPYDLASGDLIIMKPPCQAVAKHKIGTTTKAVGPRINWTFRPHRDHEPQPKPASPAPLVLFPAAPEPADLVQVVNVRDGIFPDDPDWYYVGRDNPSKGLKRSPLANPYRMSDKSKAERDRVCDAFGDDLSRLQAQREGPAWDLLCEMREKVVKGKRIRIACWCAPKRCHGHEVARRICKPLLDYPAPPPDPVDPPPDPVDPPARPVTPATPATPVTPVTPVAGDRWSKGLALSPARRPKFAHPKPAENAADKQAILEWYLAIHTKRAFDTPFVLKPGIKMLEGAFDGLLSDVKREYSALLGNASRSGSVGSLYIDLEILKRHHEAAVPNGQNEQSENHRPSRAGANTAPGTRNRKSGAASPRSGESIQPILQEAENQRSFVSARKAGTARPAPTPKSSAVGPSQGLLF